MLKLRLENIVSSKKWAKLSKCLNEAKEHSVYFGKNDKFVRDHMAIHLAWYLGLRISELCNLTWGDISDQDYVTIKHAKGSKDRTLPFGKRVRTLLDNYKSWCESKNLKTEPHLRILRSNNRRHYTPRALSLRMAIWVEKSQLPPTITFHSLRHGFATRMLEQGLPLPTVRDLLGHSNIAITSVYLHVTEDSIEKTRKLL